MDQQPDVSKGETINIWPIATMLLAFILIINFHIFHQNKFSVEETDASIQFSMKQQSLKEFYKVLDQFPFTLTQDSAENTLTFVRQLANLRHQAPINPYTGFPVLLLSFVTLAQFQLSMNFFCSLSQIHFHSKFLLLVTTDPNCYTLFKTYNIPIYLLNLSSCSVNYFGLTKIKIIVSKILLLLNFECLLSDIDIEFFDSFDQYLFCPKTFDIGFWYEAGTVDVSAHSLYYLINTGFTRFFPTSEALSLIDEWMIENKKYQKEHDQTCIQKLMADKNVIQCNYFEPNQSALINRKGYWNCKIKDKSSFIWHIFPERKMVSGCEFLSNSVTIRSFKSEKIIPSIFHLICLRGEENKKQFLDKSELWFYNASTNKCTGRNAIQNWNHFFNSSRGSILKTSFQSTLKYFPPVHVNADISNFIINDEIANLFTHNRN